MTFKSRLETIEARIEKKNELCIMVYSEDDPHDPPKCPKGHGLTRDWNEGFIECRQCAVLEKNRHHIIFRDA